MILLSILMMTCFLPFLFPDSDLQGGSEDSTANTDEGSEGKDDKNYICLSNSLDDEQLNGTENHELDLHSTRGSNESPPRESARYLDFSDCGSSNPSDTENSPLSSVEKIGHESDILGTSHDDVLFESAGNTSNEISGRTICGLDGSDRIYGEGSVTIDGGSGDDVLVLREISHTSTTTAIGGEGSDIFVIEMTSNDLSNTTADVIMDYNPEIDRVVIELSSSIEFDPEEDITYSSSMEPISIDKILSTSGTTLSIAVMESIQVSGSEGDDFYDAIIHREVLLEGIFEIDINDISFIRVAY